MDWMNWKTWAIGGLIIVGVFAIYTFAATQSARISDDPLALARTSTAGRTSTAAVPAPGVGIIHMEWLDGQTGSYNSERNLFAYKEPPPPPPPPVPKHPVIVQPPPPPPLPVQPVQPQPPPVPQPPPFPYHYIGTFGTPANPIATFSGDGKIINVRTGDTIDGKFILRGIGIESVEIGFVGFPPEQKTRIAIGQ
jgi:hypothetical protein